MLSTIGLLSQRHSVAVDADVLVSLAVIPAEVDRSFLQRMFDDANGRLFTAQSCREGMAQLDREHIPIVICADQLPDGSWKDVLSRIAPMLEPPRLIVASRHADERLWSEVLSLGGFDLLATPFREVELGCALGSAWFDWKCARARGIYARSAGCS
jgi:DNA-binding NtrC family response regulator